VTNWFKKNPFAAGLAAATAVLTLAAIYFVYAQNASFVEQTDTFSTNTTTLGRLQSAKPFPNQENLKAAESEAKLAAKILDDLAAEVSRQSIALDPSLTPRDFQDKLSSAVAAAETAAASTKVVLPEDFYLGFADYKAQPPSEAAAPMLGQQLETIANVTGLLLKSGIRQLVGIERAPLPSESDSNDEENKSGKSDATAVQLAPFDVELVADPVAFRNALSAIVTAQPVVLVRLVSVTNSNPTPPAKESAAAPQATTEPPTASGEGTTQIPVVFGKETLNVKLRLASLSVAAATAKE
jgi:hypothetical protein